MSHGPEHMVITLPSVPQNLTVDHGSANTPFKQIQTDSNCPPGRCLKPWRPPGVASVVSEVLLLQFELLDASCFLLGLEITKLVLLIYVWRRTFAFLVGLVVIFLECWWSNMIQPTKWLLATAYAGLLTGNTGKGIKRGCPKLDGSYWALRIELMICNIFV